MKYLESETFIGDAECSDDAIKPTQQLEERLNKLLGEVSTLPNDASIEQRLKPLLESGYIMLDLDRLDEAWEITRPTLDQAISAGLWLQAVEACDILYQTGNNDALRALAHGIWLGVTFPIEPGLSVAMLQHLVDETPDNSDGAAVAAATAGYIADMRAEGPYRQELKFFTNQLMGQVARRHSQVEEQEIFDFWVERMELDDPSKFLPRLAQVLDIVNENGWWFDRDELRDRIPADH